MKGLAPEAGGAPESANPAAQRPKKAVLHTMDQKCSQNIIKNSCFAIVFGRPLETENPILYSPSLEQHTGEAKLSNPLLKRQVGELKVSNPVLKMLAAAPKV